MIKFHCIHRTAKLWTTQYNLLGYLALVEWWMIAIVWNVTSTISQLRAFALCVPIWSNYLLSFLCKILVYRIFYICGHFSFISVPIEHRFQSGPKVVKKKGATHPMFNYLPINPLQNFGLPYFLYVRTSSIQINDNKR